MQINLEDLASKRAKSSEGLTISDHTIDLNKFTGSELIISGTGSRGLVIKNSKQMQITFRDFLIDNASTGVGLKFDGITEGVKIIGERAKIFGKAGNSASQCIYVVGTWRDVELGYFEIDQRRNRVSGTTTTGACVQFAGVPKADHNLGKVHAHHLRLFNAGDEGCYFNHFEKFDKTKGITYADGEELILDSIEVENSGRDFLQQQGFRKVHIKNCAGKNGGLEADPNHCSALSMNPGITEDLIVDNCHFQDVSQLVFADTTSKIKGLFKNVVYNQGTHAGARSNQAAYLKGPGVYDFQNCTINAQAAKIAGITADGCEVRMIGFSNVINAPTISRTFNGSVIDFTPAPEVVKYESTIHVEQSTSWNGDKSYRYFINLDGEIKELILK